MGTPTFLLDAMVAAGLNPDALAPAGIDTPGGTDMNTTPTTIGGPVTRETVRKLARKILKGDVAATAQGILLLKTGTLPAEQAELLRVNTGFMLADVAEAPAQPKTRGTRKTDAGTALAARVRQLAVEGDRARAGMRAKKLAAQDTALTVAQVEGLSDAQCMDLVSGIIREGDTAADLLEFAELVRGEA